MRIFLKSIHIALKVNLAYPRDYLISLVIYPFILILNIHLFTSIYAYSEVSHIKGYSLSQMIWYYGATTFVWIFIFNFTDRRISNYILTGELGLRLLRPVSLFQYEMANAIALRIVGILFEFIPGMVIYSLIYSPNFLTIASLLKFFAVVALAFVLNYVLNFIIGVTAFITQNNAGFKRLMGAVTTLLGGAMIPLDFFPGWLQTVCDYLPFKYLFYEPVRFFINHGDISTAEAFYRVIFIDIAWIAALYIIAKIAWKLMLKNVVVAGG